MKCLSLWQPWATLMWLGVKRFETRSWPTSYRGPLAIAAAKKWSGELAAMCQTEPFWGALKGVCDRPAYYRSGNALPMGAVLCVVNLDDCLGVERLERITANRTPELDAQLSATLRHAGHDEAAIAAALEHTYLTPQERPFGDYSAGRYAWITSGLRRLPAPVPIRGYQGLFEIPDELVQGGEP